MKTNALFCALLAMSLMAVTGCREKAPEQPAEAIADKAADKGEAKEGEAKKEAAPAEPALKTDKGVDAAKKVIRIGALNDMSGPAAAIGKPYAIGKQVAAGQVNAGGSGLLPDGWTVELVERDHGYNPQKSVQAYKEIKDEILFIGTSFGTPPTLPLRKSLERDGTVAFPASLSSKMAEHRHTPPLGPSYTAEARRAMDWAVEKAGGADKVKAAIIYQQDDYGSDGLAGFKAAAAKHGVTVVSEQTVQPGQKDFAAIVTALKAAEANYVLLTVLPSATGPILGTAAKLQYGPTWIGQTPSWIDAFFIPKFIPAALFGNFYWVQGVPFWGEKVPGMDRFMAAWEAYKKDNPDARPDFFVMASYIQGLMQLEAAKRAIEAGDITRAGFLKALGGIKAWNGGGISQPIDLSAFPYVAGKNTRVLKPVMDKGTWEVIADYAAPKS